MARAPKTIPAKPRGRPRAAAATAAAPSVHAHEAAAADDAAPDGVDPSETESMELAGFETEDGKLTAEGATLINSEPAQPTYTGPISPTPPHLIRMTHPEGGVSDGFKTDESGAVLVPIAHVEAMKGHGFVVDHLPAPDTEDAEVV